MTEVGYLVSPINRQTGCTQFSSSVVGGPTTTVLPVCTLFLCDDNCTTGDITYQITSVADFYGKRVVIIKSRATAGFKIKITAPINFVTTGSTTLNLPDAAYVTELIFPITAGGVIGTYLYDGVVPVSTNIYNSNGTLTGNRSVSLGGFNLSVSGTGNITLNSTGTLNLGITGATTAINIGSGTTQPVNFQGNVRMTSLASVASPTELVTWDSGTRSIGYVTLSSLFANRIFSMGKNAPLVSTPEACSAGLTKQFPNGLNGGGILDISAPSGHSGYNFAGLDLNTTLGTYTPSQTNYYDVLFRIDYICSTESPNLSLIFRNTSDAVDVSTVNFNNVGAINQYSSFTLTDRLLLNAAKIYTFLIVCNNTTGFFTVANAFCSINKI